VDSSVTIRLPALVNPKRDELDDGVCVSSETLAPEASDETLLALVCEGNKEALSSLFTRYARIVRGVAYRASTLVSDPVTLRSRWSGGRVPKTSLRPLLAAVGHVSLTTAKIANSSCV
jgi:hypothetical protein